MGKRALESLAHVPGAQLIRARRDAAGWAPLA